MGWASCVNLRVVFDGTIIIVDEQQNAGNLATFLHHVYIQQSTGAIHVQQGDGRIS